MSFILFTGGVRSGKSKLAQAWTEAAAEERLLLATCHPADAEMAHRIAAHQKSRDSSWRCLEEPLELVGGLRLFRERTPDFAGSLLIDSVGMWIANLMAQNLAAKEILRRMRALAAALDSQELPCAIVSEECGLGLVPPNPVARKFGDLIGVANQILAQKAHAVIFVACGLPLALKGSVPAVLDRIIHGYRQ